MFRNNHARPYILTGGILGILLGVLLVAIDFSKILSTIFIIIGIFILVTNLPSFIFSLTSMNLPGTISSALPLLGGALMIFWHSTVLVYIIGVYLVVLPLTRILIRSIFARYYVFPLPRVGLEVPRLIMGVLLLIIGPGTAVNAMFDIAGYVIIGMSVIFILLGILKTNRY